MGSGELVRAKWTLGIAAACVAALGLFSCAGGDVTGITILSAAYDVIYEFDSRTCCDEIDNDGDGSIDEPDEDYCLDTCRDTDGNGICEGGDPVPCPPPGSDEIRLELLQFDGAVARFALLAHNFTISNAWRIRFGLTFNSDLLRYTYPSPGVGSHSPEYPGAVPWKKIPPIGTGIPDLFPDPGPGEVEGLADDNCWGCCIEWTDYSCTGPGKKGETCTQDLKPNDVKLCIKRSCVPSTGEVGGFCPAGAGRADCCNCSDTAPQSRHCRRTDSNPACATSPEGQCHNNCDQPLFTELAGDPDADKQIHICCAEKALLQVEDWECLQFDQQQGICTASTGCEAMGLGQGEQPLGVTPQGVVATVPLHVKAAREFDDFRFLFDVGGSSVSPYNSDAKTPLGGAASVAGKGTVIATD